MKNFLLILVLSLANEVYSQDRFSLKAHSAIVLEATKLLDYEIKKEINEYLNFVLMGAGSFGSEDYSEDSTNDYFGQIYICKPVSSVEHFYDPYDPDYIPWWNRCNPPYGKSNALNRAKYLYNIALKNYNEDKRKAYYYLGRALHILSDLSVPAHVHFTPHPFWPIDDNYENFHKELVIKPEYLDGLKKIKFNSFDEYFINIALETKRFPSDFNDGYHKDNRYYYNNRGSVDYYKNGFNYPLNKKSIDFISRNLVKLAISYTAGVIEFFYRNAKGVVNE